MIKKKKKKKRLNPYCHADSPRLCAVSKYFSDFDLRFLFFLT